MRVLICQRAGKAFGYITDGWINALRDRGHEVQRWDGQQSSWDVFDPDLFCCSSGHKQPIPIIRRAKIALHVNSWGPIVIDNTNESKENISESAENIKWVIAQKPDVVFGYGFPQDQIVWSYWTQKAGIPWVSMPTAGDKIIYHDRYHHETNERKYDIVYLGGRWPYKSQTLDKYLLPALKLPLTYKIHGWGNWPPNICSGELPDGQATEFLSSGKVGPCVSEKHTHQYGIDIPERVFKLVLCGALAIHDPVPRFETIFPCAIIARDPQDYAEKCLYFVQHDEERRQLINKQRQYVLNNHTYHHRIRDLLCATGFHEEAQNMI